MNTEIKRIYFLVSVIILICFIIPILLYLSINEPITQITPAEARALLTKQDSGEILVDVRTSEEYDTSHVYGSVHWPLNDIY